MNIAPYENLTPEEREQKVALRYIPRSVQRI